MREQRLAQVHINYQNFCRQDLSKQQAYLHHACIRHAALSALQEGSLLVPQYLESGGHVHNMASQLDPNMGMDPSMERSLQQEEEEDQYNNGLEDAIHQEQGDADQGAPPPFCPPPPPPMPQVWCTVAVCMYV